MQYCWIIGWALPSGGETWNWSVLYPPFHSEHFFSMSFSVCGSFEPVPAVCTCVYMCVQTVYGSIWINWCQAKEMRLREKGASGREGQNINGSQRETDELSVLRWLILMPTHTEQTQQQGERTRQRQEGHREREREAQAGSTVLLSATWTLFPQGRRVNRQVGTATAGAYRTPRILINSYIPGENDEKPKPLKGRQMRQSCSKHTDQ